MKHWGIATAGIVLILALAFSGCQTAKSRLVPPAESAVEVEESGFAPRGSRSTIGLSLFFGNPESIKSWTVTIEGAGAQRRTWSGDAAVLPDSLVWDGTVDGGSLAPEGAYTARLAVEYVKQYQSATAESRSFLLVTTPPSGSVTLDPAQFVPSDPGVRGPVTLHIDARSALAKLEAWKLEIYDQAGGLVKSATGRWPAASVEWDGSLLGGGYVAPLLSYRAVATVRDEFGLSSILETSVPVADIPLAEREDVIAAGATGFSPRSQYLPRFIDLGLTFGNREALKSWKVSVAHGEFGVQRTWTGDAAGLPRSLSWDGRLAEGSLAPEGTYTAFLSIDYGTAFKSVFVRSGPFILDYTPPAGSVSATPSKLAADGQGGILPVTFTLYASATLAPLKKWSLAVLNAAGAPVATYEGSWPAGNVVWDGRMAGGATADPRNPFGYLALFRDELGNLGEVRGSLATGELPEVRGSVSVTPEGAGFSPNADRVADTMPLALSYGQPDAVVGWTVDIGSTATGVVRTFKGDGKALPARLRWDGRTETGGTVPDGLYTADLNVNYGTVFSPASARSKPFALVVTPPAGEVILSTALFSPIEGADTITLSIRARSPLAAIDSWTMDIEDPAGDRFRSFAGKWPASEVVWDGKNETGELVQSAEEYTAWVKVRDQFGNTATLTAAIPVDILVERRGDGYRILASRIFFKAFTADYVRVPPALAEQNEARLDALAEKLAKFPDYRIRIVGHAVMIYWDDPARGSREQEDILVPLSKARADAVRDALVERGLDAGRFATEGVGAADQLVPDSDYVHRWQNRRVALFLERD